MNGFEFSLAMSRILKGGGSLFDLSLSNGEAVCDVSITIVPNSHDLLELKEDDRPPTFVSISDVVTISAAV